MHQWNNRLLGKVPVSTWPEETHWLKSFFVPPGVPYYFQNGNWDQTSLYQTGPLKFEYQWYTPIHELHTHHTFLPTTLITRTTRTPAFWGYPTPPNDYPYHWVILDPKSKEDKVKVTNLKKSPKFLLKLLDKMCKYEMDPMSIVEDTERTRFCPQTDRRTDGQGDTSVPPFQLRWSGGYNYHWITDMHQSIEVYVDRDHCLKLCWLVIVTHNNIHWKF